VLANFLAENATLPRPWNLYVDGLSTKDRSGADFITESPAGVRHEHALKFMFNASNNEAEYEASLQE